MTSNIVKLFTEFLIEMIKIEMSKGRLSDINTSLDYYNLDMCINIFKKCTQSIVQNAQNK